MFNLDDLFAEPNEFRVCDKCKAKMADTIGSAIDKPKKVEPEKKPVKDGNRMRFLQ